jgi:hypothetical protein
MTVEITEEHLENRELHDFVIDPDHDQRTESPEFRKSKKRLKEDGHMICWICDGTKDLQVHHLAGEYMFNNVIDFDLLKEFCEEWDIYGYGKLLKAKPIATVDDIRNMMVLCQPHHTGVNHEDGGGGTGIHALTFSSWVMQKLALKGADPVPQQGETFEQAKARIKKFERK